MTATPTVHVVEDDASVRTALLRLIKAAGLDANGYESAEAFLTRLPAEHSGCVLLDMHLPGASGLALQEALPLRGISLPVVFITAHPDNASRMRALKAGAVDYLHKPVDRDTLLHALQRALAQYALMHPGPPSDD